jgi:hypothetical protein
MVGPVIVPIPNEQKIVLWSWGIVPAPIRLMLITTSPGKTDVSQMESNMNPVGDRLYRIPKTTTVSWISLSDRKEPSNVYQELMVAATFLSDSLCSLLRTSGDRCKVV